MKRKRTAACIGKQGWDREPLDEVLRGFNLFWTAVQPMLNERIRKSLGFASKVLTRRI